MTPTRLQRKSRVIRNGGALARALARRIGLAVALALAMTCAAEAGVGTTERVVTDPLTGLAIDGIDPVGYFTDAAPLAGRPEHELRYAGVIWRFRNEGNAAAFAANPEVYMPRYGGYDPIGIGRSVAVPGNPLLWLRWGDRLYLFHTEDAREQFVADPADAIHRADSAWPAVLGGLVP